MEHFFFTICHGCNRFSVLCDMDPQPCEGCDCEYEETWEPWWPEYERISQ